MKLKFTLIGVALGLSLLLGAPAAAQSGSDQLSFDSFTGIYHLSRDNRGLSLLTTEETIVADFPSSGLYGIRRVLPKKFQAQSVDIKILSASDAAGNPVPYKTTTDKDGNLVITTGDPAISLYGSQTIKISYQTRGVINLSSKTDEFLLNVNGRGWDQAFTKVNGTLYVAASFRAKLKGTPSCYTSLNSSTASNCQISTQKNADTTVITSKARFVPAHQALVLKLNFEPATFTNNHAPVNKLLIAGLVGLPIVAVAWLLRPRRR